MKAEKKGKGEKVTEGKNVVAEKVTEDERAEKEKVTNGKKTEANNVSGGKNGRATFHLVDWVRGDLDMPGLVLPDSTHYG